MSKESKAVKKGMSVKVLQKLACPFCSGAIVEVSRVGKRTGAEAYYEVIKQCKKCGFVATFKEAAKEAT